MDYYNVEHPDYYTLKKEVCNECEDIFLVEDIAEFFFHVNGNDLNFCCEQCMCSSLTYYFNIAQSHYASNLDDFVFDNDFTCSHPDLFASEWANYSERVKHAVL